MMKLDDIYLIERATGKLVKQVHFNYGYLLAKGTPNSVDEQVVDASGNTQRPNPDKAKLTLVSVQTFGTGGTTDLQSVLPPYKFKYNQKPDWGTKYSYDRWGFHKSDGGPWRHRDVNGDDQSAWSLTMITLPSGGTLQVQYEPKDYARVQDRVPLNPRANQRTISNYLVDLAPWVTANPWPSKDEDWVGFRTRLRSTPFYLYPPRGHVAAGIVINPVQSSLNHVANNHIPIQSAPNPKDLKLWLVRKSPAYLANLAIADRVPGIGSIERNPDNQLTPDVAKPKAPQEALDAEVTQPLTVERMVNINFEYWTAGMRGQKRMTRPLKVLEPADIGSEGDDDRTDVITRSTVVRMRSTSEGGVNMFVTDPDFEWPKEAPNAMYVTWTANPKTPKLGGGVRVKRIVSNDGLRSFTTAYVYTDFVNGEWTTSGVAAQEPPPFGFSADDDRVIQTEKGGWANEGGGGIYHSRVVVRHGWSEDSTPAGIPPAPGMPAVETPLGETVFRFISPSDLPHRVKDVDYAWNRASTNANGDAVNNTNSARITEIFNVGAWWGRLLWKEDRDRFGKVLGRVENYYTQLEGYLRIFPETEAGRAGYDVDVEKAWNAQRQQDTSYTWAESSRSLGIQNLPTLVRKEGLNPAAVGKDFPTSSPGYLNTSVNITVMQSSVNRRRFTRYKNISNWKDLNDGEPIDVDESTGESDLGWHSSIKAVREVNLAPIVREVRTYGEGLKLLGVTRNTKWDARTGGVMETETRGRKSAGGDEWMINRSWPAYWMYQGMEVQNMLSQGALTTTLRRIPGQPDVYLNSKATTWWQPDGSSPTNRWMKGGDFVWNGLAGVPTLPQSPVKLFPDWTPLQVNTGNLQLYKSSNWLFAGAVTKYDAFAHALEAVDGDGVYGCSKYGYPYGSSGDPAVPNPLPARILPVAKFANARYDETLYYNFEGHENGVNKFGSSAAPTTDDPLQKLAKAYTGERAWQGVLPITAPTAANPDGYELRYFVKAPDKATAQASFPSGGSAKLLQVVQAEQGLNPTDIWWFIRARVGAGVSVTLNSATPSNLIDDVAVFPWRNNGAPVSVSHYAYDRALGLVTSITGSNGRTARYQYDSLGRLKKVFDVYGKPTSSTRYRHVAAN